MKVLSDLCKRTGPAGPGTAWEMDRGILPQHYRSNFIASFPASNITLSLFFDFPIRPPLSWQCTGLLISY